MLSDKFQSALNAKFQSALCYVASSMWQSALSYAGSCYILKCNVASFITLCSIFYVPSDKFQSALNAKFQSALCYVASSMWQSALCYAGSCYILKCNVASFITLCSIFYVPSDKFQSTLNAMTNTNTLAWDAWISITS